MSTAFDRPLYFEYVACTGEFGGNQYLYWKVSYPNNRHIQIVTNVVKGEPDEKGVTNVKPDLEYLEYLVSKGCRFINCKEESVINLFNGYVPKLAEFLSFPWVAKHDYIKNLV